MCSTISEQTRSDVNYSEALCCVGYATPKRQLCTPMKSKASLDTATFAHTVQASSLISKTKGRRHRALGRLLPLLLPYHYSTPILFSIHWMYSVIFTGTERGSPYAFHGKTYESEMLRIFTWLLSLSEWTEDRSSKSKTLKGRHVFCP